MYSDLSQVLPVALEGPGVVALLALHQLVLEVLVGGQLAFHLDAATALQSHLAMIGSFYKELIVLTIQFSLFQIQFCGNFFLSPNLGFLANKSCNFSLGCYILINFSPTKQIWRPDDTKAKYLVIKKYLR
jgi:hypothetical protein